MELSSETVRGILSRWMDEGIVTDYCSQYGEPGYELSEGSTPAVVLGSYWCRQCPRQTAGIDTNLHAVETHHPRLWAQLERQGLSFEWYDEWIVDHENDKCYRTAGDSYAWMPSYVWCDSGDILTPDDEIDAWIEWAANDSGRCIPSRVYSGADLERAGFVKHNGRFENGWHPGQDDDPNKITETIREQFGEQGDSVTIVFALDDTGQFDIGFSAYYRAYVATVNIPGYMPMDDDPPVFADARSAWEYLADERERQADSAEDYGDDPTHAELRDMAEATDGEGTVYGPTPGYDGDHDLGLAYCVTLVRD